MKMQMNTALARSVPPVSGVRRRALPALLLGCLLASTPVLAQSYSENFNDGLAQNWIVASGTWAVSSSIYNQTATGSSNISVYSPATGGTWNTDFTYSASCRSTWQSSGNRPGIVYNYTSSSNYGQVMINTSGLVELGTVSGGTLSVLATGAYTGGGSGVWVTVEVVRSGSNTTVRINGATIINNFSQPGLVAGRIGLKAKDNATASFDNVVVTSSDTTPPTVSVTAPASGAFVGGSAVAVSATASDNIGVVGVQFKLDGANLGAEDTASPYSINWDTTGATNGSHSLTAVARDAAGNSTTSSAVNVTVDNSAPTVSVTAPVNGAFVLGSAVAVSATASDDIGVVGVQFKLDGANLGAEDTASPYSINWDSTSAANGSHALTAVARDSAGNSTTSSAVNVTVDNSAPTVSVTAPPDGSTQSGTIPVSATASDNVGVAGVQFKLNGADLAAEDTASPYSISWDTTTASNAQHVLSAVARDAAGNATTSGGIFVTVNNAGAGLPAPWSAQTIGVGSGTASFDSGTSTFTVTSTNGGDIWGTSDSFQFVHQSLNGDGQIVARVVSEDGTGLHPKAGIMIRESLAADSKFVDLVLADGTGNIGSRFQWRDTTGGTAVNSPDGNGTELPPHWLRLTRVGNSFTAEKSADGTAWTQVGTAHSTTMSTSVFVGLVVSSYDNTHSNTGTFTNVTVTGSTPAGWTPFGPGGGVGVVEVIAHPSNPDIVYAVTDLTGVFKSTDGGLTFFDMISNIRRLSGTFHACNNGRHTLAMHPTAPDTLYYAFQPLGVRAINGAPAVTEGIWKTTNGGLTWTRTSAPATMGRASVIVDHSGRVFAFQPGSSILRVSTDGGLNWTQKTSPVAAASVPQDPATTALAAQGEALVLAVNSAGRIFCSRREAAGAFYSDNQGNTWTQITSIARPVQQWAIRPGSDSRVLALLYNSTSVKYEIWVSGNGTASPPGFTKDGKELTATTNSSKACGGIAINTAGTAVAWGTAGVTATTARAISNNGTGGAIGSWSHYTPNVTTAGYIWISNSNSGIPNRLVASGSSRWYSSNLTHIMRSADANALNWTREARGIAITTNLKLVVDVNDPNHLEMGTGDVGHARTTNLDASWTDTSAGNFQDSWGLAQSPSSPLIWYRINFDGPGTTDGSNVSFHKSTNNGVSWTFVSRPGAFQASITQPPKQYSIMVDPTNPNTVFVGTHGSSLVQTPGLYRSTNGGVDFTRLAAVPTDMFACKLVAGNIYGYKGGPSSSGIDNTGDLGRYNIANDTWTVLWPRTNGEPNGYAVHPTNPAIVFVAVKTISYQYTALSESKGELWKTTNGLNTNPTWTKITDGGVGLPGNEFVPDKIYIDPSNTNVMLMSTYYVNPATNEQQGVMRSLDGGATWSAFHTGLPQTTSVGFVYGGVARRVYFLSATMEMWRRDDLYP